MEARGQPDKPLYNAKLPWLPHPELRETVPNISLYSCLYQLPHTIKTAGLSDKASDLDKQLAAAVDFFNLCVPNQPGFSSSVAAVTLLPEPSQVALAWKKWYFCGKRLRKLRFIRSLIQTHIERQQKEEEELLVVDEEQPKPINQVNVVIHIPSHSNREPESNETTGLELIDSEGSNNNNNNNNLDTTIPTHSLVDKSLVHDPQTSSEELAETVAGPNIGNHQSNDRPFESTIPNTEGGFSIELSTEIELCSDPSNDRSGIDGVSTLPADGKATFTYASFDSHHFARSLGFDEETKLGNLVTDIEIEQLSVYAREYAQRYASIQIESNFILRVLY